MTMRVLLLFLIAVSSTRAPATSAGAWLDLPLTNWNTSLTAVPRAKVDKNTPLDPRCNDTHRSGHSAEDKQLTSAGWTLFGEEQQLEDVALVTALTGVDGMCRPLGYQAFVFVGGKLAGTVSPQPMDSRADGSTSPIHLMSASTLTVGFARYAATDARCCPSKRQIVTYTIDRSGPRPLLVPRTVMPLGK
jgi:LppP/LprE lipoprotein